MAKLGLESGTGVLLLETGIALLLEMPQGPIVAVEINGVQVTIRYGSFSTIKRIEERSTASFVVIDEPGIGSFPRGTPVEIFDEDGALIFAGFVDTPEQDEIAPDQGLFHSISCIDNHYLADKRLVVKSYTSQTLKYIVEDIVTDYLVAEGVTIGEVQTGPTIEAAIFNHIKASEAFDALKELSGFTWYIDELKRLYFIDRTTNTANWDLDGVIHKAIEGSEHLSLGNPLYRNLQYIWGGTDITTPQTEVFIGDGVTVAFTLGYPLALSPSGATGSVNVTGRTPTLQTVGVKGPGTDQKCYWNKGDATITFNASDPPEDGATITVVYSGQFPLISAAIDSAAIVARQAIEGGSGIVEEIVREAWHESRDASRQSAQAKLTQYCRDAEKFIYQTRESGLAPGQLQAITHSPFGFSAHPMLIESISVTADVNSIIYDVTCITGPAMGSWTRFFSKLVTRQDQSIRVGGDLLLKLLIKIESLGLAETTDLHSDDFSSGIVNRWIALPPAQSSGHNVEHEILALAEAPALTSHETEHYHWGDARWGFATWG